MTKLKVSSAAARTESAASSEPTELAQQRTRLAAGEDADTLADKPRRAITSKAAHPGRLVVCRQCAREAGRGDGHTVAPLVPGNHTFPHADKKVSPLRNQMNWLATNAT